MSGSRTANMSRYIVKAYITDNFLSETLFKGSPVVVVFCIYKTNKIPHIMLAIGATTTTAKIFYTFLEWNYGIEVYNPFIS